MIIIKSSGLVRALGEIQGTDVVLLLIVTPHLMDNSVSFPEFHHPLRCNNKTLPLSDPQEH